MTLQYTKVSEIRNIVSEARQAFASEKTRSNQFRKQQLRSLITLLDSSEREIVAALQKDLRKPMAESYISEIAMIKNDAIMFLNNLDKITKPFFPSVGLIHKMDNPQIRYEPLGVVLIIGAWNYPIQLTLLPLVGAIAAGNCVVIKPSEISSHTATLLADLIPKFLDPTCFKVINGSVLETTELLEQRFDHILYTGNSSIGKVIMTAAAKHLTPVTLELGGKSPVILDSDVDVKIVARRVAWGRFINAGQTCIAPDYVLCNKSIKDKLVTEIAVALKEYYGEDPQKSADFARIVNVNHFNRVSALLKSGKIVIGGKTDEKDLYIAPTVIVDPDLDSAVMQNEIFGPVLPIVEVDSVEQAISFVNNREKPLALYVFSNNPKVCENVLQRTSSGGAVVNDTLLQATVPELPFGGVGNSGTGGYHGKHSFDLFSHKKGVIVKNLGMEGINSIRYPPYSDGKLSWLQYLLVKKTPSEHESIFSFRSAAVFGLIAAIGYASYTYFLTKKLP